MRTIAERRFLGLKMPFGKRGGNTETVETNAVFRENEFNTSINAVYGTLFGESNGDPPYTIKQIQAFAKNPQAHYAQLRKLAWWAYYSNGTVSSAIDALKSIFTLDSVVVCRKARRQKPPNYNRNKDLMTSTLDVIRYKQVIRDALFKNANDGMYVAYFDVKQSLPSRRATLTDYEVSGISEIFEAGYNATVTSLPIDYVRIVGRRNNSFVVAFDLKYFVNLHGTEREKKIKAFPTEIREAWAKREKGSLDGDWVVLNNDKTIVTKIKSEISDPFGIPFAIAALDDIEYAQYFINSKRKLLETINNQVIYQVYPEGQTKNTSSLTGAQQRQQHETIRNALFNRRNRFGISFFSLAAGTKLDTIKVDTDLLDEKNENGIKNAVNKGLGISATALDGSSSGNFAATTINLEIVAANVYTWIEEIVLELNKCINANIIKDSACKVEFYILPTTFVSRDKQVRYMRELYANGKGSLTAWIASTGFNPEIYLSLMDYELEEDFENKYPVHKTSFNVRGTDAHSGDVDHSAGRPKVSDSTTSSTISTSANNSNNAPKPSTS